MTLPTAKWTPTNLAHPTSLSTRLHSFNTSKSLNRSNTTPSTRHPLTSAARPVAIAAPHRPQTASSPQTPLPSSLPLPPSSSSNTSICLPPDTYLPRTRATIIGAGMAGLLAARVASRHFDDVVIIERDGATDKTIDNETLLEVRSLYLYLCQVQ